MSLFREMVRLLLAGLFASGPTHPDIRIQIRRRGETIWRDFSFVSDHPEAVQGGLRAASNSIADGDVRAVDRSGRMVDFG